MSLHDSEIPFRQMLDHAREATTLSNGKSPEDLVEDRLLGLALVRLMEIIGEAANRISKQERSMHPEIPWTQIVMLLKTD